MKLKIGDRVVLDKEGNTGIISSIVNGMAQVGRGAHSTMRDLIGLKKAK